MQKSRVEGDMEIDKPTYDALKKAYQEAIKLNMHEFNFRGKVFNVEFVRYVLEFTAPSFDMMN